MGSIQSIPSSSPVSDDYATCMMKVFGSGKGVVPYIGHKIELRFLLDSPGLILRSALKGEAEE